MIAIDPYTSELELRTVDGCRATRSRWPHSPTPTQAATRCSSMTAAWCRGHGPEPSRTTRRRDRERDRVQPDRAGDPRARRQLWRRRDLHPRGTWWVDDELIMQHSQTIAGTSPDRSIIKAHDDFPFDDTGEVAVIHGTRDGSGNTNYADGGPLSRYYLRDFLVDGRESRPTRTGSWRRCSSPPMVKRAGQQLLGSVRHLCAAGSTRMFTNIETIACDHRDPVAVAPRSCSSTASTSSRPKAPSR